MSSGRCRVSGYTSNGVKCRCSARHKDHPPTHHLDADGKPFPFRDSVKPLGTKHVGRRVDNDDALPLGRRE
jgi:hypothetical protein